MSEDKKAIPTKERSKKDEEKLSIGGRLENVLKVSVPKTKPKK
ncbi:MAG: hypothetical protein QMC70_08425 [Bacteroidia bacterium]|jgi:hypothetical protein|tara:strand:+ start:645 stop:773 length:129 start_codon:yes stop_codon:yes gene_type:complete